MSLISKKKSSSKYYCSLYPLQYLAKQSLKISSKFSTIFVASTPKTISYPTSSYKNHSSNFFFHIVIYHLFSFMSWNFNHGISICWDYVLWVSSFSYLCICVLIFLSISSLMFLYVHCFLFCFFDFSSFFHSLTYLFCC